MVLPDRVARGGNNASSGYSILSNAKTYPFNGVNPNMLYRWRRLLSEGGAVAVNSNEEVVAKSEVTRLNELERALGRKTLEAEILQAALEKADQKKPTLRLPLLPKEGGL